MATAEIQATINSAVQLVTNVNSGHFSLLRISGRFAHCFQYHFMKLIRRPPVMKPPSGTAREGLVRETVPSAGRYYESAATAVHLCSKSVAEALEEKIH
ncbi:hypothetical protein Tcan_02011 [Toxocara canis]|uniref:Uncharacterized protein n=1 Tax=Toxocara canis TaxID=6265 RepID=A0A0B2UP39_TOXCA|nr:hypothetical protein Tcan_02011 [Toxocara canis]